MEIANASLLDEATAAAEAMAMLPPVERRSGGDVFFVDADCHPQTIEVVRTRAEPLGIEVRRRRPRHRELAGRRRASACCCSIPGVERPRARPRRGDRARPRGRRAGRRRRRPARARRCCVPPGEMGADVVVGSSQRFGVPLGFGGPHAGVPRHPRRATSARCRAASSACRSTRTAARRYRLALQTREQHIRREKATSNICTAQVLLAVIAGLYAAYHGPDGLAPHRARGCTGSRRSWPRGCARSGSSVAHDDFFDTITVRVPGPGRAMLAAAARPARINLRPVDDDTLGISLDETTTRDDRRRGAGPRSASSCIGRRRRPAVGDRDSRRRCARTTAFLTHPVFHRTTPRPRCCATCAGWPTATSRSTAR